MRIGLPILVLLAFAVALPSPARAGNTVTIGGITFPDTDGDRVPDIDVDQNPLDNCINAPNGDCDKDPLNCDVNRDGNPPTKQELAAGEQADWNHNGEGDACEDFDGDAITDYLDNCRATFNPDQNPRVCTDTDGDTIEDIVDNCPTVYNTRQTDTDGDRIGDACDNCPFNYNPDQDPSVCKSGGIIPVPPDIVVPSVNPAVGIGEQMNHVTGGGGCTLLADAAALPWAAAAFAAALGIAAARRRR